MRILWVLIGVGLAVAVATGAAWAYPQAPAEDFDTLFTEHFRITYPVEQRIAALRVAVLAEEAFALISETLQYKPSTPSDIVITDRTDNANGLSSVYPVQVIRLFLAPPHTADRLDFADDWLRMLVYHEMTHAFHTDQVRGIQKVPRWIFGRALPITRLQPQGFVEGLAVLHESELTTKGRNRAPHSRMLLRAAALEDRWPRLDQLTLTPDNWPGGATPYIWGGLFHQHLLDRYGWEKIAAYYNKHAGQIWPFWLEHNARVIFGTHMADIYEAWSVNMKAEFEREAAELRAAGLTPTRQLTTRGYTHEWPHWETPDRLVFYVSDSDRTPGLRRMVLSEEKPKQRLIAQTYDVRGITDDGDKLVFAQDQPSSRWYSFFDLWTRDERGRRRVTTNARLMDPAMIPGTRDALVVHLEAGRTALARVNIDTGQQVLVTELDQFQGMAEFAGIAVHPSADWAAVGVWHEDGNRDLFKFDLMTGSFTRLTAHPMRDIDPAFDPSGRYLLFSSERSGVANLYALDQRTDRLYQVTNLLGGAFMPAVDPSSRRIAFSGYNAGGYDIYLTDFDPTAWREVDREAPAPNAIVLGEISRSILKHALALDPPTDDYEAYRTVWPHYWLPTFSFGAGDTWLGARTGGYDVAGYHSWDLQALWGFENQFPFVAASYSYSRFAPTFQFTVAHNLERFGKIIEDKNGNPDNYYERRVSGVFTTFYPLFWKHTLFAGYIGQWRSDFVEVPDNSPEVPFSGYWSGVRAGWYYDQDSSGRYVSFPLGVGASFFDPAWGSDVKQQLVGASAGIRIPFPVEDLAFSTTARSAMSFGDLLAQRTFRLGGYAQASPLFVSYKDDRFQLRGYNGSTAVGDVVANGTAQLAFPVAEIEHGFNTWPVYARGISGIAFGEGGFAVDRNDTLLVDDILPSVGTELYFDFVVAYSFAARLRYAVSYGFRDPDDTGGFHWLLALGGILP
jgi:WD40-like Beta Propeller Repeat